MNSEEAGARFEVRELVSNRQHTFLARAFPIQAVGKQSKYHESTDICQGSFGNFSRTDRRDNLFVKDVVRHWEKNWLKRNLENGISFLDTRN